MKQIVEVGASFAVIATFLTTLVAWGLNFWLSQKLHERFDTYDAKVEALEIKIDERTKPIQPESNGGKSLPDAIALLNTINSRIDRMENRQVNIGDTTSRTEGALQSHIDSHNS